MEIIRSFEQSLYTVDELDRAILRAIRAVMIEHDLWETFHEGTFEAIVKPNGALYVDPAIDDTDLFFDREYVNVFMRELLNITYANLSISLTEDGEQGMTYLYIYAPDGHDLECNCTDPYCGV